MSPTEINPFLEVEWLGGGSGEVDVSWVILGDLEVDPLKKDRKVQDKVKTHLHQHLLSPGSHERLICKNYFTKSCVERHDT